MKNFHFVMWCILHYCQKQTNGNLQFNYDNKKEMLCLNNIKTLNCARYYVAEFSAKTK